MFKNPFHLIPGSITDVFLADNAVTAAKLAASAVTSGAIAANAVLTAALADAAVTTVKITDNAITAGKIQANAVTADAIAAGAIIAGKIAAGTITANELAANAITAGKIAAGAIDGKTITGAVIQTAAAGARWVIDSISDATSLTAYSGKSNETTPAFLTIDNTRANGSSVRISSANMANGGTVGGNAGAAQLELQSAGVGVAPGGFSAVNVTAGNRSTGTGGLSLNGGKAIRAITSGTFSDTSDANGQLGPFNHLCGEVPTAVIVNQTSGPGLGRLRCTIMGGTTFVIQANRTDTGAAYASQAFTGWWIAIAGV